MSNILVDSEGRSVKLEFGGYYYLGPASWGASKGKDDHGNGYSSFNMNVLPNGVVHGEGFDSPGKFVISGAMVDDEIRFAKMYINSRASWIYIGRRVPGPLNGVYQYTGSFAKADSDTEEGQWVFTGVPSTANESRPKHSIEGEWDGYFADPSADNATCQVAMSTILSIDPAVDSGRNGPFQLIGNGRDKVGAFSVKGTAASDGRFEVIKSYFEKGHSWKYQGIYDGDSTIGGIWGGVGGGKAGGTFAFNKKQKVNDVVDNIGSKHLGIGGQLGPVSGSISLDSALKSASDSHHQGILTSTIDSLAKGFHFG